MRLLRKAFFVSGGGDLLCQLNAPFCQTLGEGYNLAELHQYEQARDLSVDLLVTWLSAFKFKNWTVTGTHKKQVTDEMKKTRAKQIAEALSDNEKWHSHGRGINIDRLRNELNLQIEDFSADPDLAKNVREYFGLLTDYMVRGGLGTFVHTRDYF